MTQPPYDDDGSGARPDPSYPRQELLPQEVQPGRSRLPLIIGAGVLAFLIIGGLLTWWALRDDGEGNRAAYCDAVRTLTHNGDLQGALSGGVADAPAAVAKVRDLAPSTVRSQWDDLYSLVQNPPTSGADIGTGLRVVSDLRVIVDDANDKCDMNIDLGL